MAANSCKSGQICARSQIAHGCLYLGLVCVANNTTHISPTIWTDNTRVEFIYNAVREYETNKRTHQTASLSLSLCVSHPGVLYSWGQKTTGRPRSAPKIIAPRAGRRASACIYNRDGPARINSHPALPSLLEILRCAARHTLPICCVVFTWLAK